LTRAPVILVSTDSCSLDSRLNWLMLLWFLAQLTRAPLILGSIDSCSFDSWLNWLVLLWFLSQLTHAPLILVSIDSCSLDSCLNWLMLLWFLSQSTHAPVILDQIESRFKYSLSLTWYYLKSYTKKLLCNALWDFCNLALGYPYQTCLFKWYIGFLIF